MNRLMVKDIMSTDLVTLEEDEDLDLADSAMKYGRIRHLPVVRGKRLVGLITHRDLLRAQVSSLADLSPEENSEVNVGIKAHDVMQENVTAIGPATPILEAARIIKNNKYGCLPVVDDKNLVGIVTEADFISLIIRVLED